MRYESKMIELNPVEFPKFNNERVYMLPFYKKEGLPSNLSHWKKTVDQMLLQIETNDVIYLMIDQAFVKAGTPHRRPGLHIDGYWVAGSHSGRKSTNEWSSKGSHGNHKSSGSHSGHKSSKTSGNWSTSSFSEHEAILLASNVSASRAFTGQFEGPIKDMGDCDHFHKIFKRSYFTGK